MCMTMCIKGRVKNLLEAPRRGRCKELQIEGRGKGHNLEITEQEGEGCKACPPPSSLLHMQYCICGCVWDEMMLLTGVCMLYADC